MIQVLSYFTEKQRLGCNSEFLCIILVEAEFQAWNPQSQTLLYFKEVSTLKQFFRKLYDVITCGMMLARLLLLLEACCALLRRLRRVWHGLMLVLVQGFKVRFHLLKVSFIDHQNLLELRHVSIKPFALQFG